MLSSQCQLAVHFSTLTATVTELESQVSPVILLNGQRDFDHLVPNRGVHVVKDDRLVVRDGLDVRRSVQAVL